MLTAIVLRQAQHDVAIFGMATRALANQRAPCFDRLSMTSR
jgi:hypothetical protein